MSDYSYLYQIAHGFNVYIDTLVACNARCPFCIAPTIGRHNGPRFMDGVDYALELASREFATIQIVGGEPTISNRLEVLLKKMSLYKDKLRRSIINTNAARLDDLLLSHCVQAKVEYINISRHHYDGQANQAIMLQKPAVFNAELAKKIEAVKRFGIGVRLNCQLILGNIDSFGGIERYIKWGESLGVSVFSFSQTFPLSLFDYQKPPVLGYTESVQVDLEEIVCELDSHFVSTREPYEACSWGSGWGRSGITDDGIMPHRRFWLSPKGSLISLKTLAGYDSSTGLPIPTWYDKAKDRELNSNLLAYAVVHPDGLVTGSWDRRERLLFDPYQIKGEGYSEFSTQVLGVKGKYFD